MNEPSSPLSIALSHRCPACGEVSLYRSWLSLKDECDACGTNFREHDVGDGPAFFTITLLGFVVVGLAFVVEVYLRPAYWVHGVIVMGAMAILTPLCLRFFKSYLVAMKYKVHWSQGVK